MLLLGVKFVNNSTLNSFVAIQETKAEEARQLELAERGQGKQTAVREAEVQSGRCFR
jgi:hypothetical protein